MWLLESPRPVNPERYQILSGPERIETGWWESPPLDGGASHSASRSAYRDYFVAMDPEGARCWLFKPRILDSNPAEQWYLHGFFS